MSDSPQQPPQQPPAAPPVEPSMNGSAPASEPQEPPERLEDRIAREVTLTWRAVEEIDMRLATIQIEVAILVGLTLLALAAQILAARKAPK